MQKYDSVGERFNTGLWGHERGEASSSYLTTIVLVAVIGVAGFKTLGGAMQKGIANDGDGGGMAVSAQAGEADVVPTGTTTTTTLPSSQAAEGSTTYAPGAGGTAIVVDTGGLPGDRIERRPEIADNEERRGGGILNGFANGVIGVWDGAFETVRGIKEGIESVVWDFGVEDVLGGIVGPILKIPATGINALFGTHLLEDMSWIPLKDAVMSAGHFFRGVPGGVWGAITSVWHHGSICLNIANHQSAGNRGYACGRLIPDIVNIVYGAKGLSKAAMAAKEAGLALRESMAAATEAEARVARIKNAAAAARDAADEAKTTGKPKVPEKHSSPRVPGVADDLKPISGVEGKRVIKELREEHNRGLSPEDPNYIGGGQNVALVHSSMPELADMDMYATSGGAAKGGLETPFDNRTGEMGRTIPRIDDAKPGATRTPNTRMWDSERIILEEILRRTTPESAGTVKLFTLLKMCRSCSMVLRQFEAARPNIKIILSDGKTPAP